MVSRRGKWLRNALHRRGIVRILNSTSSNAHDHCTALVETRGPKIVGEILWQYALHHDDGVLPLHDWDSEVIKFCMHVGPHRYRWLITYRRV